MARTAFESFIAEEIRKNRGRLVPVRASLAERMFVHWARLEKLHPNPDDEFCFPSIGPNYGIISQYMDMIRRPPAMNRRIWNEPIVVQKVHPEGYMILNGHHRWAAAVQLNHNPLYISVVNLTQETDVERMIRNSRHDRRVTLDLDEVVFCADDTEASEKPLPFPYSRWYKERIRLGVPALLHYLSTLDYDIWVYTARYYSYEYVRALFRHYSVRLDGIMTGTARKTGDREEAAKRMETLLHRRYEETLHIDRDSVLRTGNIGRRFEMYPLEANDGEWARAVMDIVKDLNRKEA